MNGNHIAILDERATAKYWTSRQKQGDALWMTPAEIQTVNRLMRKRSHSLVDLAEFPSTVSGDELREKILVAQQMFRGAAVPGEHYAADGSPIGWADYQEAQSNCALVALGKRIDVRYGLTVRRSNLRLLPTKQNYFDDPDFRHYDDLQGTALDPAEPLLVLHESRDGVFLFVQARHYAGWVKRAEVVFANRDVWETYVEPKDFLVVTAHKKNIRVDGVGTLLFQMGSILPIRSQGRQPKEGWNVSLPVRTEGGWKEMTVQMPEDESVHRGWLPFTRNNVIRQAFRFLGETYDWGGMVDSVDCSAFVGDVYRSMGAELPRDADEQEQSMPHSVELSELSTRERYQAVGEAPSGALLFKYGHVLLYLGQDAGGTPLAIHASSSYFVSEQGAFKKYFGRQVLVSDLRYQNGYGTEVIDDLTTIGFLKR